MESVIQEELERNQPNDLMSTGGQQFQQYLLDQQNQQYFDETL